MTPVLDSKRHMSSDDRPIKKKKSRTHTHTHFLARWPVQRGVPMSFVRQLSVYKLGINLSWGQASWNERDGSEGRMAHKDK